MPYTPPVRSIMGGYEGLSDNAIREMMKNVGRLSRRDGWTPDADVHIGQLQDELERRAAEKTEPELVPGQDRRLSDYIGPMATLGVLGAGMGAAGSTQAAYQEPMVGGTMAQSQATARNNARRQEFSDSIGKDDPEQRIEGPTSPGLLSVVDAVRSVPGSDFFLGSTLDALENQAFGHPAGIKDFAMTGLELGVMPPMKLAGKGAGKLVAATKEGEEIVGAHTAVGGSIPYNVIGGPPKNLDEAAYLAGSKDHLSTTAGVKGVDDFSKFLSDPSEKIGKMADTYEDEWEGTGQGVNDSGFEAYEEGSFGKMVKDAGYTFGDNGGKVPGKGKDVDWNLEGMEKTPDNPLFQHEWGPNDDISKKLEIESDLFEQGSITKPQFANNVTQIYGKDNTDSIADFLSMHSDDGTVEGFMDEGEWDEYYNKFSDDAPTKKTNWENDGDPSKWGDLSNPDHPANDMEISEDVLQGVDNLLPSDGAPSDDDLHGAAQFIANKYASGDITIKQAKSLIGDGLGMEGKPAKNWTDLLDKMESGEVGNLTKPKFSMAYGDAADKAKAWNIKAGDWAVANMNKDAFQVPANEVEAQLGKDVWKLPPEKINELFDDMHSIDKNDSGFSAMTWGEMKNKYNLQPKVDKNPLTPLNKWVDESRDVARKGPESHEVASDIERDMLDRGYDMSAPGRLARAKYQGFDTETPYYHTTAVRKDFDEWDDPNDRGGIYVNRDPDAAYEAAQSTADSGQRFIPTYLQGKTFGRDPAPEWLLPPEINVGDYSDFVSKSTKEQWGDAPLEGKNKDIYMKWMIEHVADKGKIPKDVPEKHRSALREVRRHAMANMYDYDKKTNKLILRDNHPDYPNDLKYGTMEFARAEHGHGKPIREALKYLGFDNISIFDEGGVSVMSDPTRLRSRYAAFDPARHPGGPNPSKNMMHGIGGTAVGAGLLYDKDEEEEDPYNTRKYLGRMQ